MWQSRQKTLLHGQLLCELTFAWPHGGCCLLWGSASRQYWTRLAGGRLTELYELISWLHNIAFDNYETLSSSKVHSGPIRQLVTFPSNLFSILTQTSQRRHSVKDASTHAHTRIHPHFIMLFMRHLLVLACVCERESKSEVRLNPQKRDIMHMHTRAEHMVS